MRPSVRHNLMLMLAAWPCALCETYGAGADTAEACDPSQQNVLPLTPAYVPGTARRPAAPSEIRFEGQTYDMSTGKQMLMLAIMDEATSADQRADALRRLSQIIGHLPSDSARAALGSLDSLYSRVDAKTRRWLLMCVTASQELPALAILDKVLKEEKNPALASQAAAGLGGWNVRRGVEALIRILDTVVPPVEWKEWEADVRAEAPPDRKNTPADFAFWLRGNALQSLMGLNDRKGWGFPLREVQAEVEKMGEVSTEAKLRVFADRWKAWFEVNKERFPVWPPEGKGNAPASAPADGQQPGAK
jgi:hypothetical protein